MVPRETAPAFAIKGFKNLACLRLRATGQQQILIGPEHVEPGVWVHLRNSKQDGCRRLIEERTCWKVADLDVQIVRHLSDGEIECALQFLDLELKTGRNQAVTRTFLQVWREIPPSRGCELLGHSPLAPSRFLSAGIARSPVAPLPVA